MPPKSRRVHWIPWSWSKRQLGAVPCRCWELNVSPMEKPQALLAPLFLFKYHKALLFLQPLCFWGVFLCLSGQWQRTQKELPIDRCVCPKVQYLFTTLYMLKHEFPEFIISWELEGGWLTKSSKLQLHRKSKCSSFTAQQADCSLLIRTVWAGRGGPDL